MDEMTVQFLGKARGVFGTEGGALAEKALGWARERHGSAQRASGEPAWEHDLRVASTLLDMGMDLDSVLAGLVHDITENRTSGYFPQAGAAAEVAAAATQAAELGAPTAQQVKVAHQTKADHKGKTGHQEPKPEDRQKEAHRKALAAVPDPAISAEFGEETARLVAGVARLSSVRAKNKTVHAAETMRKMLFAMTGDIRVIIVKLADKLDSMRTLKWLPEDDRRRIAAERVDVFAPLADRLGIVGRTAMDVSAACSGFLFALETARAFVCLHPEAKILVTATDVVSSRVDYADRGICVLFGDGAGAAIITGGNGEVPAGSARVLDVMLATDGSVSDLLTVKGGGSGSPYKPGETVRRDFFVEMNGREVYKYAVRAMSSICKTMMEKHGLVKEQVDVFIPHQANLRIIDAVGSRLEMPAEKIFTNVQKYGNTSAASVIIALSEARAEGFIKAGHRAMLLADASPGALLDRFAGYKAPTLTKWVATPQAL